LNINDLVGPVLGATRKLGIDDSPATIDTWDSVRQVDLILAIEEALGVDLTPKEIDSLNSCRAVAELFAKKGVRLEFD
jgi:acyl carrier protein